MILSNITSAEANLWHKQHLGALYKYRVVGNNPWYSGSRLLGEAPYGLGEKDRWDLDVPDTLVNEDKKNDEGKPDPTALPWSAVELIAKCMADGSKEYGPRNYLGRRAGETKAQHIRRYLAAGLRHLFKAVTTAHDESGHLHIVHGACNCIMAIDIYVNT